MAPAQYSDGAYFGVHVNLLLSPAPPVHCGAIRTSEQIQHAMQLCVGDTVQMEVYALKSSTSSSNGGKHSMVGDGGCAALSAMKTRKYDAQCLKLID